MKKKCWYAIYTKSRAEKKVFEGLTENNISAYLPLKKQLRQWSDRKKKVELPLFNNYVFVYINLVKEKLKVLKTENVIKFVSFSGEIDPIQDKEIETIKLLLGQESKLEVNSKEFKPGVKVKIAMGNLKGIEGEIVRGKKNKILIRMSSIKQNILVEISALYLEKII